VEYDETKSAYSTYEEYYLQRVATEGGEALEEVDAHILQEQVRIYSEEHPEIIEELNKKQQKKREAKAKNTYSAKKSASYSEGIDYNYHESADLEDEMAAPRNLFTETELFWSEVISRE